MRAGDAKRTRTVSLGIRPIGVPDRPELGNHGGWCQISGVNGPRRQIDDYRHDPRPTDDEVGRDEAGRSSSAPVVCQRSMCSCRLRTTCSSSAIFPMTFLLGCGTPACFHERSMGGRWVAAYRAIWVRYRRAERASGQPDRRTFPGPSVRITCLATAITGGAVRLSSLWSLLRGRSPRSGAGLAVARTGWCRARGCSTGSGGWPG